MSKKIIEKKRKIEKKEYGDDCTSLDVNVMHYNDHPEKLVKIRVNKSDHMYTCCRYCDKPMQLKLKQAESLQDGWFKQWIETKCWNCKTPFTMFRKNMFNKYGNNQKSLKNAERLKKRKIEIEEEEEEEWDMSYLEDDPKYKQWFDKEKAKGNYLLESSEEEK